MREITTTVEILASPAQVWAVLVDVERWPDWTPTVTAIERLDTGPLILGSRTRIHQPRLRPAVWQVTEFDPSRGIFIWQSRSPGVVATAAHLLQPLPAGCLSVHSAHFSGIVAPLAHIAAGKLTQQYLRTEADSLKARCEI